MEKLNCSVLVAEVERDPPATKVKLCMKLPMCGRSAGIRGSMKLTLGVAPAESMTIRLRSTCAVHLHKFEFFSLVVWSDRPGDFAFNAAHHILNGNAINSFERWNSTAAHYASTKWT
jgi:hypothetical protein